MRKVGLNDPALLSAVAEMSKGLIDADLGGNILKKRIPLPGRVKRGGVRTLVATRLHDRWFFLYGFAKNEQANINQDELKALQEIAKDLLSYDDRQLESAMNAGIITKVTNHDQDTAQKPASG